MPGINNRPQQDEGTLQAILKGKSIVDQRLAGQANPDFWKKDLTDKDYLRISAEGTKDIGRRSTLKDITSAVARGVPALGKLAGHAIKTLDPEGGVAVADSFGQTIIDVSKGMEAEGVMKPVEVEGGFVKRGIMAGLESAIPSLAPSLGGAAAGALAGSVVPGVGTVLGGIVGGTLATLGIHGLGTYGQERERYLEQGIDQKEAHSAAIKQGLIEGGLETVSNLVGMMTFGWGKMAMQPLKKTAQELLHTPIKTFAKNLTKNTFLNEVPMEMVQGALSSKVDEQLGLLPEGEWQQAAVESIIPAITMSVLFGVGAQTLTSVHRGQIKNKLNSDDPKERIEAAQYIAKQIDDKELGKAWVDMVTPKIADGEPIDINADFTQTLHKDVEKPKKAKDVILDEGEKTAEDILTKEPEVAPEETLAAEEAAAGITEEALEAAEPVEEVAVRPKWVDDLGDDQLVERAENLRKVKEEDLSDKQKSNFAMLQEEMADRGIVEKEAEDAEGIRREAEAAGERKELERKEKERIRLRDTEKDRLAAEEKKADEVKKIEAEKIKPKEMPAESPLPMPKKQIPPGTRTLRGAIKAMGGMDFLNFHGELKDLPLYEKRAIAKKGGVGVDLAVDSLVEEGWLPQGTTVASFLEELRTEPKRFLARDKLVADITTKKPHELSLEEKRLKEEMEHEPEAPPKGEYVSLKAEDLPKGKKLTLLEGKAAEGWDVYEVIEKDPFEITLKDGNIVKLSPLDKVQVLKGDLPAKPIKPIKPAEPATKKEVISPDGTYVNRDKIKMAEKDGLKATYFGVYRKDGAFKAWKTASEIDTIIKAEGKPTLGLKQEYYGKQAGPKAVGGMEQVGLGLEVEPTEQPSLFPVKKKAEVAKKPAVEKRAEEKIDFGEYPIYLTTDSVQEMVGFKSLTKQQILDWGEWRSNILKKDLKTARDEEVFAAGRPAWGIKAAKKRKSEEVKKLLSQRKALEKFIKFRKKFVHADLPGAETVTEPSAAPEAVPEFEGVDISKIIVEVEAIREATGEMMKVKEPANIAMESIDKDIETYYFLLNCITA